MKNSSFIPAFMRKAALLVVVAALPVAANAQNNSVSVFGSSSACGSSSNTFNISSSAGSPAVTGIASLIDAHHPTYTSFPAANATYSPTGQLLFSADQNGIYKPDGSVAHDFTIGYTTSVTVYGGTTSFTAKQAISDVAVFPCVQNGNNKSYYAVFWATVTGATYPIYKGVLRVVKVTTDDGGTITSCTDNVLYDATSTGMGVVDNVYGVGDFAIAADQAPCGGSRSVYTLEPYISSTIPVASKLRKWVFPADGSLPNPSTATYRDMQYYNAYCSMAKIMNVQGTKYFGFIGSPDEAIGLGQLGHNLVLWDLSHTPLATPAGTANVAVYTMGSYNPNSIFGFEHPNNLYDGAEFIYVSYQAYDYAMTTINHSGLAFFTPVSRGTVNIVPTLVAGSESCGYTDIQQDKNDNLYMVSGMPDPSNGTPTGILKYMAAGDIGHPSVTLHNVTCSGGGLYTAASRIHDLSLFFWGISPTPFYLWKPSPEVNITYPSITDIDISTRCAPGSNTSSAHPGLLPQYSVSSTGGATPYSYLWTPMPPVVIHFFGTTITIPLNGVNLDNYNIGDPTVTSLIGGSTPLAAAHVLTVKDNNGCATSMNVRTALITSGFDLASRDSHFDMYDEANTQALFNPANWNIWNTQDLWNRYHANGTLPANISVNQSPGFPTVGPSTNYLYTYIKNVGCADYVESTTHASLHTYWTMGGFSGETWANSWNGVGMTPASGTAGAICNGTTKILGHELTASPRTIADLAVGDKQIIETSWTPPDPHDYYPTSCTAGNPWMELCFLSRIVDGHNASCTDGMTICEITTGTISNNVRNNNNIATLNTNIIYITGALPKIRPHIVIAGNAGSASAPFSIQMANQFTLHPGTGVSNLNQFVRIDVALGDLFAKWVAGGSLGTYSSVNYNTKTVTFDGTTSVRLDNIVMDPGAQYPIAVSFNTVPGAKVAQMPQEMVCFRQLSFSGVIDTLVDTLHGSYVDTTIDSVTNIATYDTIQVTILDTTYHQPDSVYGNYNFIVKYQAPGKGVLAVTEMSNGPSGDCEYAEMVVANCGDDLAPAVDVSGWIMDDNSGNFNTGGCMTGVGVAQGHYRLANDGTWANVPVGSVIVMYNHDANCYNMSDTFKIDTTAAGTLVYWIPVGGTVATPYGVPHVERFGIHPAVTDCAYCANSDTTAYAVASSWANTIGLNNTNDAFQVRCPGCSIATPGAPAFYHGIGYGSATGTNAFASIPVSGSNLGGPVKTGAGTGKKYVFDGLVSADLGDPAKWSVFTADVAGTTPSTLGNINATFQAAIQAHQLEMPCCGANEGQSHKSGQGSTSVVETPQGIRVYPNPANDMLNFQFPSSEKVTIRLLDISGRLMQERVVLSNTSASFNVAGYAPGIYLYQVITDSETASGKITIQN